jgi:hypothetical protein
MNEDRLIEGGTVARMLSTSTQTVMLFRIGKLKKFLSTYETFWGESKVRTAGCSPRSKASSNKSAMMLGSLEAKNDRAMWFSKRI